MTLAAIPFPDIDPVMFSIGSIEVRWYGLAYALGFVIAWFLLRRLCSEKNLDLTRREGEDLIFYAILGVVLGGRLGYVFFYKLSFYLDDPFKILRVWEGGMSFHGGLIGVVLAGVVFARRRGKSPWPITDALALVTAPGLFLGRCANFINGELWGRPGDVPWAVVFPDPAAGGLPRHPSQLYEALLEGLVLFLLLWSMRKRPFLRTPGRITGLFLIGYGCFRFIVEFYREPDHHLGPILGPLSMGQVLSALMVIAGAAILAIRARPRTAVSGSGGTAP